MKTREESREKEKKFKETAKDIVQWLSGAIALGILVFVTMSVVIEGNRVNGLKNAEKALSEITIGEELPWTSLENRTWAVIECNSEKYFVSKIHNAFTSDEIIGCTIYLAKDVEILASSFKFVDIGKIIIKPIE